MIEYRTADLSLAESIFNLEKACFSDFWSLNSIISDIKNERTIWIAAMDNENLIGYINAFLVCGEAELNRVAVSESYRNCGIGKRLFQILAKKCAAENCFKIYLEVRESNKPALNLYESVGFEKVGLRKNYYSCPNENAIIMASKIN